MEVIDDEGRLLGVVNVVDALVVLLALAVVVAGAALVFGGSDTDAPDTATAHVTLDLGTQPGFVIEELDEGDTHSPSENSQLTVTDVHLTPRGDDIRAVVRAQLEGQATNDGLAYSGAPPRLGRTLTIATNRYQVEGQIRAVGTGDALTRADATVVLRSTMTAPEARTLATGDEIRIAGRTVATIDDVAVYATDNPDRRLVYLQTSLATHSVRGEPRFGGQPVRAGQSITLPGDGYTVAGTIERVGAGLERGDVDILLQQTVDIETADRLAEGDAAVVAGATTATVERVELYGTANPDRKRAFVGLSLSTVGHGDRPQFGATPVQSGRDLTIRTPEYTLTGPIERVGHLQQRGTSATRTVTLRIEGIREEFASAIEPGMVEQVDGQTVAEVTDVGVEPTTVVVTGDRGNFSVYDHPYNRDVTVTAEIQVRETTSGPRFKGESIRQRDTITLDLDSISLRGTVVSVR